MSNILQKKWWKITGLVLVFYAIVGGMLLPVPARDILNETIRNLYYHVTMWFTMIVLLTISVIYAIKYLSNFNINYDIIAREINKVAMLFALLGLFTGMLWAKFTWGAYWTSDPKLNGVAASLLVYAAYFLLRNSLDDSEKRARFAAVYNIFAYVMMLVFILIMPRLTASLHPGNGGNPAFASY
ncbi:MAG TPA: cytochrome c biogenesis protein CcsA, partial [Bacteroidia bacterium]|nr:cytochrome c biogenesis protein CcsA [Bacteroidia bacterium]